VHDRPAEARSDGPNALPLDRLDALLERLAAIHALSGRRAAETAPPARPGAASGRT